MNPFLLSTYKSAEYFCDRENESRRILNAIENSRNITLVSERKLGKTALLNHIAHQVSGHEVFLHIDLYPTQSLSDFIKMFANAVIQKLEPFSETVLRKVTRLFQSLNAKFSLDAQTGLPNLELSVNSKGEAEKSIELIFQYIKESTRKVTVAFDEFQQILNYPENNVEALLRTEIQKDNSTCYIFSGSHTHLLLSIFNQYSRPFYQSTEIMELKKIAPEYYRPFMVHHFTSNNIDCDLEQASYIYELNLGITYNVQYLCNKLYSLGEKVITKALIDETLQQILLENEVSYYNYRALLSKLHYSILKAVAREGSVEKPLAQNFLVKYKLGSASSVKSALDNLESKGLLVKNNGWRVSDWFFSLWLKSQM